MSIQEKNVNTSEKKDRWIQIRITDSDKEKIEANAKSSNKSVSQYIRDLVLTNNFDNVNTEKTNVNTLKDCILEFNKLMSFNRGELRFPGDFNKIRIIEGVKECRLI